MAQRLTDRFATLKRLRRIILSLAPNFAPSSEGRSHSSILAGSVRDCVEDTEVTRRCAAILYRHFAGWSQYFSVRQFIPVTSWTTTMILRALYDRRDDRGRMLSMHFEALAIPRVQMKKVTRRLDAYAVGRFFSGP